MSGSELIVRGQGAAAIEVWSGKGGDGKHTIKLRGGNSIRTRGGVFRLGDTELGESIEVLIVDWCYANQLFVGDFDPDTPSSPVCWSHGLDPDALFPAGASEQRSPTCSTCSLAEFGSGKGKAKACKEGVSLAVIPARQLDVPGFDPSTAATWLLRVPPTSVASFLLLVHSIDSAGAPLQAAIVECSMAPGRKGGFSIEFAIAGALDAGCSDLVDALTTRDVSAQIMSDPVQFTDDAKPGKPTRTRRPGGTARKAPAKAPRKAPRRAPAKGGITRRAGNRKRPGT